MSIDTGKATIKRYNDTEDIVIVDIYADGELTMEDVDNIHTAIEQCDLQIPVDTICVKSGKNHLSDKAFEYSLSHNWLHKSVVYVIKHMADIHFPSEAQQTYFKDHLVDFCTSTNEAYHLIKKQALNGL